MAKHLESSSGSIADHLIELMDPEKTGIPRDAMEAILDMTHRPSSSEDQIELVAIAVFTLMDTDQSGDCSKKEACCVLSSCFCYVLWFLRQSLSSQLHSYVVSSY